MASTTAVKETMENKTGMTQEPGWLPKEVRPETYDLKLTVDPKKDDFSGELTIQLQVVQPTKKIVLNSADATITKASLNGTAIPSSRISADPEKETVSFSFNETLRPGPAALTLSYASKLNREMKGLYLSTAKHDGKDERYAFTQFEPNDARRMFPCFDEPAFKAKFSLTVTVPKGYTVISNMPAAKTQKSGSQETIAFGQTPKMSTYLLALAVAHLSSISRKVGQTEVTVWTRPEDIGQAVFALDTAEAALTRLNAYFDLPYQLPKLDLVAVPDFAAGAMENWGAIFFRDSAILIDPKLSSAKAKRRVAEVVTHEIVHQWFGDLVTMKWWNDLWLNEAFATWVSYKIVDQWQPDWLTWQNFERGKREALTIDSLDNTRPISSPVNSPAEIEGQFDALTYEKGGAVLRMLENFLSEEKFRDGLRKYIAKYQYQNTEANDLWRELEAVSGQPVPKIAADWITIPGYPLVSVEPASKDNRTLKLSQSRFSAHGPVKKSPVWNLPVVLKYKDASGVQSYRVNLTAPDTTVTLPGKGPVQWVYPNQGQTGFYRSSLDKSLIGAVGPAVTTDLDVLERVGLLNDIWARTKSGDFSLSAFLDFTRNYQGDSSRMVLEDQGAYLSVLNDFLVSSKDQPALAKFAASVFEPQWKRLGWTVGAKEDDETKLSRSSVLWTLGSIARPEGLIKEAQKRLADYSKDPSTLDPALVLPVLNLGAMTGDADRFKAYQGALKKTTTPEQRDNYLVALAKFKKNALAKKLLEMTLTDDIRGQDLWKPVSASFANTTVQAETWDFVKSHWPDLRKKTGDMGCRRIIDGMDAFWDEDLISQLKAFFAKPANQVEAAKRVLAQSLELAELGVRFKKTQASELSAWLKRA